MLLVDFVLDDGQDIKSRQNWFSQIYVVVEVKGSIVGSLDGVSGCDD